MKKYLALLLLICVSLSAQQKSQIDSVFYTLSRLEVINDGIIMEKLGVVFLKWKNDDEIKQGMERLLYLASRIDKKYLYIRFLTISARVYSLEEQAKIFDRAYSLAEREKYYDLMGISFRDRAIFLKDSSMTDSAMIYSLKARTIFEKYGYHDLLVSVLHTIADLHYFAGQYHKAEELYKEVLNYNPDLLQLNFWRFVVINNDLGLIRIKQGKYSDAEKYFNGSINFILAKKNNNFSKLDSLQLSYTYRKLFQVSLLENDKEKEENYYGISLSFAKKLNQSSDLAAIFTGKGKLYFQKGQYDSALVFFKQAQLNDLNSPDISAEIDIYDGLAKSYISIKDFKNASNYQLLARQAESTSDSIFHRAKYMTLYAEYNYQNYLARIAEYKQRQFLMILVITISITSLIVIAYFFMRLRSSNRKLV